MTAPFQRSAVTLFQPITPAEAISSLAPTASASIRTGSVTEMMTVRIPVTKTSVVRTSQGSHHRDDLTRSQTQHQSMNPLLHILKEEQAGQSLALLYAFLISIYAYEGILAVELRASGRATSERS